ncbi:hypothetical protein GJ496_000558 [Pomphorhynchus laevis]|nr:hypothetical protein GJ496_000558 [Pomphorhynchus laevis]
MDDRDMRTVYCGSLPTNATDMVVYELFLQAGPIDSLHLVGGCVVRPGEHQSNTESDDKEMGLIETANRSNTAFAFITFKHECSVPYAIKLLNGVRLYGHHIRVSQRKSFTKSADSSGEQNQQYHCQQQFPNKHTSYNYQDQAYDRRRERRQNLQSNPYRQHQYYPHFRNTQNRPNRQYY